MNHVFELFEIDGTIPVRVVFAHEVQAVVVFRSLPIFILTDVIDELQEVLDIDNPSVFGVHLELAVKDMFRNLDVLAVVALVVVDLCLVKLHISVEVGIIQQILLLLVHVVEIVHRRLQLCKTRWESSRSVLS